MGSKQKNAKGWAHLPAEILQSVELFLPIVAYLSSGACWGHSLAPNIRDRIPSLSSFISSFLFYLDFGSAQKLSPLARVTTPLDDRKLWCIHDLLISRLYHIPHPQKCLAHRELNPPFSFTGHRACSNPMADRLF
jgi:hypothetical protein